MNLYKLHSNPEQLDYYNEQITIGEHPPRIKEWFVNSELHKTETSENGNKFWYLNDKLHREDGPAQVYTDGEERWWLNNTEYSKRGWREEMGL